MSDFKELKAKIHRLTEELSAARKELFDAKVAANPLKIGARIILARDNRECEVVSFQDGYSGLQPVVRYILKGGSLGKSTHRVWGDYTLAAVGGEGAG